MKAATTFLIVLGFLGSLSDPPAARGQVSFPAVELLGRPTATSVTVNVVAGSAIQAYFQYGTVSGGPYTLTSPAAGAAAPLAAAANVPLVAVLTNLAPDTRYYYRMIYRQTGTSSWLTRPEYSFHTQRAQDSTFTFTIGADSHINIVFGNSSLYQQTLKNIASEMPDFHLDLGDTFAMDGVTTQAQADSSYLNLRSYFGLISPSVPIFLALGNHEQEEGWHRGDTGTLATTPPVLSTNARNKYYLNPDPLLDPFYTGNRDVTVSAVNGDHAVTDYYAWQWGDALFVVIDPYWYSTTKPYVGNQGGGESSQPGSGDRWDWTLGAAQYQWLEQTLAQSTATYKFIFAHQVAGGIDDYGRGGAAATPYVEWGGYDDDGVTWNFDDLRPGWDAPVHELLVKYDVTAFFHAHDHEFAYEKRDGVVYQLVPMAADATYGYGFQDYHVDASHPYTISVLPNSGHLRVTVSPTQVTVDYVRAFLAGAGANGQVAYTYSIPPPAGSAPVGISSLSLSPTSVRGGATSNATVTLNGPATSDVIVTVTSSDPSTATAPSTVSIPATATSAAFTVATQSVSSAKAPVITATFNGSAQATLTVNPAATGVASLTLNPTSVVGGANATGTVTLNGLPPSSGGVVALSSGNTAAVTVPASITIPGTATSATFTATSLAVGSVTPTGITAGFNNTSVTTTLTVNPPPRFSPVRINAGGPAYTDTLGQSWAADTGYSGGGPYTVTKTITSTADPTLYKTARYGSSFSYTINAPAGAYTVTLKFAELYWTTTGKRVFNVATNGTTVLSKFDIVAAAGAGFKAVDKSFTVNSTGTITIQFTTGSAGNPLVNAIQVVAAGA